VALRSLLVSERPSGFRCHIARGDFPGLCRIDGRPKAGKPVPWPAAYTDTSKRTPQQVLRTQWTPGTACPRPNWLEVAASTHWPHRMVVVVLVGESCHGLCRAEHVPRAASATARMVMSSCEMSSWHCARCFCRAWTVCCKTFILEAAVWIHSNLCSRWYCSDSSAEARAGQWAPVRVAQAMAGAD